MIRTFKVCSAVYSCTTVHFACSIQYDTVQAMAAYIYQMRIFFAKRLEQSRNKYSSFRLRLNVLIVFFHRFCVKPH